MVSTTFRELGLSAPILRQLENLEYKTPTPIQAACIPLLLQNKDLMGLAQTGTGKTAAFALPLIQQLSERSGKPPGRRVRALILSPTRELAAQIHENIRAYARGLHLSTAVIFGGVGYASQFRELAGGLDILVATPGRLIDHLERRTVSLDGVETLILDEADHMLDMGFAPALKSADDALECIAQAVKRAGYTLGTDIFIALDVASSEFYDPSRNLYVFKKSDGLGRTAEELTAYYQELQKKYPIISIEDGCAENDWLGWEQLTKAMGGNTQLVGDDLFVTNVEFLNQGISRHVANAVLVKVNQIGSLTETLDTVELAKDNKYSAIISHRSGETEDATIADIAVATNAGQIKTGSLSRSDRMAKYNQLLRIEEELGNDAVYGGKIHIL